MKQSTLKDRRVLPRGSQPINGQADEDKALWEVVQEEIGEIIKGQGRPQVESDLGLESRQYRGASSFIEDFPKAPYAGRSSSISVEDPLPPRSQQRTSTYGGTILKLIFPRRWGGAIIGLLVLITGVLWGYSSPTVAPKELLLIHRIIGGDSTQICESEMSNGDIHLNPMDTQQVFIARHDDFSPPIDPRRLYKGARVEFRARPETINTTDNKPVPQAYVIEQLNLYDQNNKLLSSYTARDYNPSGHYESRWWPTADACIAVGVQITCMALFVGRKRRKGLSIATGA